jgi:hypothetical protein
VNNTKKVGVEMSSVVANVASFPRVQIKRGCDKTETLFVHPKTRKEINDPPTKTLVFFFFFFSKTINQSFIKVVDLFPSSTVVRTNATRREREKATHAQKKTIRAGVDAYLPFLSVFFSRAFWMCCCLPSSSPFFFVLFLAFFGRQELSSKKILFDPDKNTPPPTRPDLLKPKEKKKKKKKKRGLLEPQKRKHIIT